MAKYYTNIFYKEVYAANCCRGIKNIMKTRRVIYLPLIDGMCYVSPEFVGDRAELEQGGSSTTCEMTWAEMIDNIWYYVGSGEDFVVAIAYAQRLYNPNPNRSDPHTIGVYILDPRHDPIPSADEYLLLRKTPDGLEIETGHV